MIAMLVLIDIVLAFVAIIKDKRDYKDIKLNKYKIPD
jgi:hypothetical protein